MTSLYRLAGRQRTTSKLSEGVTMKALTLAATAFALCACSQSVDDQFADACAEQKAAGGMYAETSERMCKVGDYLTADQKAAAVQMWNDVKKAKARVEATKAESGE